MGELEPQLLDSAKHDRLTIGRMSGELATRHILEEAMDDIDLLNLMDTLTYTEAYQPKYPDREVLLSRMRELQSMEGITTAENIDALRDRYALIASGKLDTFIVTLGECAESVDALSQIAELAAKKKALYNVASGVLGNQALVVLRQDTTSKPRSNEVEKVKKKEETEKVEKGVNAVKVVPSYRGDAVNSQNIDGRTPEPRRMVEAAIQSRDLTRHLENTLGTHAPAANEALLLPYIHSFTRIINGKKYLLSADAPWVGERTRDPNGIHIRLLSDIENPVGVKISASASADDIRLLAKRLNPQDQPGKVSFILRLGVSELDHLPRLLTAIKEHAPGSLVISDPMHGNTRKLPDGTKTRLVSDIIEEAVAVAENCKALGMKMHGIHLEAIGTNDRKECIDNSHETPTHTSLVDPQLNLEQVKRVLNAVNAYRK